MSSLSSRDDSAGFYFPDSVVQPFVDALPAFTQNVTTLTPSATTRLFTLEEANTLIVDACTEFSPRLGQQMRELFTTAQFNTRPAGDFSNPDYTVDVEEGSRWNIHDVPPGTTPRLMRSLPARSARSDDDPPNDTGRAVIEFDFDSTIDSVIYMAHEAGHAVADDNIAKPEHYRAGDNGDPTHMAETQAYFVQSIVTDYLKRHPDPSIADAARTHSVTTMEKNTALIADAAKAVTTEPGAAHDEVMRTLHFRPMGLLAADAVFQHVANQGEHAREWASDVVLGRYGPKTIAQVFAAVGIETPEQIAALTTGSLRHAASGLPVVKPDSLDDKSGGAAGIGVRAPQVA